MGLYDYKPSQFATVCQLARGGMGRVEIAVRRGEGSFERLYAVKRLHSSHRTDPSYRTMFMDEARIAGAIQHSNVVGVLDVGEDERGPFLVMEYVEGITLRRAVSLCRRNGIPLGLDLIAATGLALASPFRPVAPGSCECRGTSGSLSKFRFHRGCAAEQTCSLSRSPAANSTASGLITTLTTRPPNFAPTSDSSLQRAFSPAATAIATAAASTPG